MAAQVGPRQMKDVSPRKNAGPPFRRKGSEAARQIHSPFRSAHEHLRIDARVEILDGEREKDRGRQDAQLV
jgi:hypothetical protein